MVLSHLNIYLFYFRELFLKIASPGHMSTIEIASVSLRRLSELRVRSEPFLW